MMRPTTNAFLEKCRIKGGQFGSRREDGFNGAFWIPYAANPLIIFKVVCSDGVGWEHVSVSLPNRCPTWEEMCWVKAVFWREDEVVMQLHPRESEYINNARFCLHLWRPTSAEIPTPPEWTVGVRGLGVIA